jgi:hypothetical protein
MAGGKSGGKFSTADPEFTADKLREVTSEMIEVISSAPFVEAMRAVRAAPEDQRLVEGSRLLNPDALRAAGAPLPKDMRISSRYFETGFPGEVELGDLPGGRVNVVNALNHVQPGWLDKLRLEQPEIFREITDPGRGPALSPDLRSSGIGGCACGGGLTFCGGAGGSW